MIFNRHLDLKGQHAFLSASKYSWIRYTPEKLEESFLNYTAAQRGTELHDFARRCIALGVNLPKANRTLNLYVNDAIRYEMTPEQTLYYSPNCFGTADAISFRRKLLRIHDLKTGVSTLASFDQLAIYAALFCLEYGQKPDKIDMELRIYQFDQCQIYNPHPEEVSGIMSTIVDFDRRIEELKGE